MIASLIRGGQVTIHSWRMATQILRILLSFMFFVTLIVMGWQFYSDYNKDPVVYKYGMLYIRAVSIGAFSPDTKVVYYKLPSGNQGSLTYGVIRRTMKPQGDFVKANTIASAWSAGKIALILSIALVGFFLSRGSSLKKSTRLGGSELVSAKELNDLAKRTYNRWFDWFGPKKRIYRIAGGVSWPKNGETLHTIITGSTGTGKTVAMLELLDQIEENGDRAIVFDKMGSFVNHFYRPERDFILNPYDARSVDWDLFKEASSVVDFEAMSVALIPQFKDTADPFWTTAARQLFASGAAAFWKEGKHDLKYLCTLLMQSDLKELADWMEGSVAQAIVDPGQPKTALSVRSILTTHLRPLSLLPEPRNRFSIKEWVMDEKQKGFLFLTSTASKHETRRAMIAAQIELAITALLSMPRSPNRRLWFIIDELPTLYQIPSLSSGLRESRQFGGAFILGTQVISELREIYGPQVAETISGNCNTRLVFNTPDWNTARWLSDNLGRIKTQRTVEGYSFGASEIRDGVNMSTREDLGPLVLPSDIMNLRPLNGYLKLPHGFPVAPIKLKPKDRKDIAESYVERKDEDDDNQAVPNKKNPSSGSSIRAVDAGSVSRAPSPEEDEFDLISPPPDLEGEPEATKPPLGRPEDWNDTSSSPSGPPSKGQALEEVTERPIETFYPNENWNDDLPISPPPPEEDELPEESPESSPPKFNKGQGPRFVKKKHQVWSDAQKPQVKKLTKKKKRINNLLGG